MFNINDQSDLVYPNSLVPIKMCSDCETCGLLRKTIRATGQNGVRMFMWQPPLKLSGVK